MICMVFSEVDIRLMDCVFKAKGDYSVRQWTEIPRLGKSDIELVIDLKACLAEWKIAHKNVALTLPDSDFLLKTTTLPKISRQDIKKYLDREVAKDLGLPVKECLYDSLASNEREVFGVKKIDLTVLAAPRTLILRYAGIVMDVGLTPLLIAPSSMAMFHLMSPVAASLSGPIALIYLGANRTTITIADGNHVVFNRRLNLSLFTDSTDTTDPAFKDAVREIKRTLLYCKKDVIGQDVVQVITAAAVPLSETQIALLREKLDIEVLPWSLKNHITVHTGVDETVEERTEKMAEGYLFALGAGACAEEDIPLQILPWSLKWKRYEGRVLQIASVLLLFFFFGGLWNHVIQKEHLEAITVLTVEREDRMALAEAAREAEASRISARQVLEARQAILSRFRERRPDFQALFQTLSQGIPGAARFDAVKVARETGQWTVSLNGKTFGKESLDQVAVFAGLAKNLQKSGRFQALVFQPVESRPEPSGAGMSFRLRTFLK